MSGVSLVDMINNLLINIFAANKYISESGAKTSLSGYSISNKVSLKQGNLYLFKVDGSENFPADIAFMAKMHVHEYHTVTGTHEETHLDENGNEVTVIVEDWGIVSETVYEPLSTHYHSSKSVKSTLQTDSRSEATSALKERLRK